MVQGVGWVGNTVEDGWYVGSILGAPRTTAQKTVHNNPHTYSTTTTHTNTNHSLSPTKNETAPTN
jgi:hypothetical protein